MARALSDAGGPNRAPGAADDAEYAVRASLEPRVRRRALARLACDADVLARAAAAFYDAQIVSGSSSRSREAEGLCSSSRLQRRSARVRLWTMARRAQLRLARDLPASCWQYLEYPLVF